MVVMLAEINIHHGRHFSQEFKSLEKWWVKMIMGLEILDKLLFYFGYILVLLSFSSGEVVEEVINE